MVSRISSMWHLRDATLVLCGAFLITACVGSSSGQRLGGGCRGRSVGSGGAKRLCRPSGDCAAIRLERGERVGGREHGVVSRSGNGD